MCGLVWSVHSLKASLHGTRVLTFQQWHWTCFREVGAGVAIGPNALFTLKELGVLEVVLAKSDAEGPTMGGFRFISGSGAHELIYDDSILMACQPSFLEAIVPMLDPCLVHMEQRCISVSTSSSGTHVLHFADGSTYEADLVVGADGIKSTLREFVSGQRTSPTYSNSVAYRSVLSPDALKAVKTDIMRPLCWIGNDKHIITYPVQANQKAVVLTTPKINVVVFSTDYTVPIGSVNVALPWAKPVSQDELLREYSGWGEDVNIILKEMKDPSKWCIHFLYPPLSSFVRQRVVLVGDAVGSRHVTSSRFLIRPITPFRQLPQDVLKAYDSIRVARANMVQKMSTIKGNIVDRRGPGGGSIPQIQEQLRDIWNPIWHHDLKAEVKRAAESIYGPRGLL
ncbi:Salicylate hydroxylase [Termitomyces sp. J132]|nr:Salicylate hydroxylase [Termitomyces sp. J132]